MYGEFKELEIFQMTLDISSGGILNQLLKIIFFHVEAETGAKTQAQQKLLIMDFHISPPSSKMDQLHWNVLIPIYFFFLVSMVDLKKETSVTNILKMVILIFSLMAYIRCLVSNVYWWNLGWEGITLTL